MQKGKYSDVNTSERVGLFYIHGQKKEAIKLLTLWKLDDYVSVQLITINYLTNK